MVQAEVANEDGGKKGQGLQRVKGTERIYFLAEERNTIKTLKKTPPEDSQVYEKKRRKGEEKERWGGVTKKKADLTHDIKKGGELKIDLVEPQGKKKVFSLHLFVVERVCTARVP